MKNQDFTSAFQKNRSSSSLPGLQLEDGARVAVMGGGPAGSLFAYYLLALAGRVDLELQVVIYEPRDFSHAGPPGCNMCAGIVSESLIQMLAVDGIHLPTSVVQRSMDSYMLHNDVGQVRLDTPFLEKRIAVVYRGAGPKGVKDNEWGSFDGFLLEQALRKGARLVRARVEAVERTAGNLRLKPRGGDYQSYDFLAVATGVNTSAIRLFEPLDIGYQPPRTAQAFIREYYLGKAVIERTFGHTIHYFLLNLPGLDFAAVVPKGSYVTICLLGADLSQELFDTFLDTPQVMSCMPAEWKSGEFACHCAPRINLTGAIHPYAERMVFLGDAGISRLYKDGLGAAYRAAKAAAASVIFGGIGEDDLRQHFGRPSQRLENDNVVGKIIFGLVDKLIKPWPIIGRTMLRMVESEHHKPAAQQRLSSITWDLFTGSAPYKDILLRLLHPAFWSRFLWHLSASLIRRS